MELKKSLSSFNDRELLELILLNQVQFERRLDRIEIHLEKSYEKVSEYINAPYNQDGRQDGHSFANTFKELLEKSNSAKSLINSMLKTDDSEISW